ncbi:MAG: hypothetical protein AAGJ38_07655 [Planctomycetota bacterium]
MPSSFTTRIKAFNAKLRKWTRTPRHWTKKPVIGTLAYLLGWFYFGWMKLVWWTSRVDVSGLNDIEKSLTEGRGVVAALFHEGILIGPYNVRHLDAITVVNPSESGNLVAGILKRMKFILVRGGSSRGKSRQKEVMGELAAKLSHDRSKPLFIAVDGSYGPARVVKPGIVALAKRVDAPLFIFHGESSLAMRLPSWDRTLIPLPFSRVIVRFCGPIETREAGRRVPTEILHQRLQDEMDRIAEQALAEAKGRRSSTRDES